MLEELKEEVFQANLELQKKNLVIYTWGNVSAIDREKKLVAIKPSGVEYNRMVPSDIVILDMEGNVVEGNLKPSSDAPTHLELYKAFENIGGVCHTHSRWATIFSQAKEEIPPYGTTHADYFFGPVPCTRDLTSAEIQSGYEKNTGKVIVERFCTKDPMKIPAVLVSNHGPFTWGKNAHDSVYHSVVLEEVAFMAWVLETGSPSVPHMPEQLLKKHFLRKHGENAYYGQM